MTGLWEDCIDFLKCYVRFVYVCLVLSSFQFYHVAANCNYNVHTAAFFIFKVGLEQHFIFCIIYQAAYIRQIMFTRLADVEHAQCMWKARLVTVFNQKV